MNKNSRFFPSAILGHMITDKVGRRPGYGTVITTGGSGYSAPPTLARHFADGDKTFFTWAGQFALAGVPQMSQANFDYFWNNHITYPGLRFINALRRWTRKARLAVYNKALVRHYTPSLLGKRRRAHRTAGGNGFFPHYYPPSGSGTEPPAGWY